MPPIIAAVAAALRRGNEGADAGACLRRSSHIARARMMPATVFVFVAMGTSPHAGIGSPNKRGMTFDHCISAGDRMML